ncbi:DUF3231 family protein [Paenibacillus rigui]|uniref:DUF3231 domain-containing protein n=1 Tax=Paenibacillus rigui TaxID=554312 RepID=A0A229UM13_9BACL|nr:DUF3231 family protein [Paenibacillus rigui]OXM84335.1 hypothetical protein CF651_21375 [Paenibacillus rigui]
MSVLESAAKILKDLIDPHKNPLHVGEVMSCWLYLAGLEEAKGYVESALSTTVDSELIHALKEDERVGKDQRQRLKLFMLNEGVTLPPAPEPKPTSDPNNVPMGVKFTDDEIANALSIKIVALIVNAATSSAQSIRTDVGLMFTEFQAEKMILGANLKELMRKRGWLKVPPYYYPIGSNKS